MKNQAENCDKEKGPKSLVLVTSSSDTLSLCPVELFTISIMTVVLQP